MKITLLHRASRNLLLRTIPVILPSCLLVAGLLLPQYGIAVEKPSRDMIVAFCEDTDGPQLSADEVQEIVEYIGIPGTAGQLKSLYQVHLRGLLDKQSAENDNAINLKLFGGPLKEVPTYEFSCRKSFRAHIRDVYLTPEEQDARRLAAARQAEEERLLAEKRAEEERLLAEKKAEEERLAETTARRLEAERKEAVKYGPLYLKRIGWSFPRREFDTTWNIKVKWSAVIQESGKGEAPKLIDVCLYRRGDTRDACKPLEEWNLSPPEAKSQILQTLVKKLEHHIEKSKFNTERVKGYQEFEILWEEVDSYRQVAETLNHYRIED